MNFQHTQVYAVVSQKGGSGKTTTATSLAHQLAFDGYGPVCLVDLDPQTSLEVWFEDRTGDSITYLKTSPERLARDIKFAESKGFNVVIIDTPPKDDLTVVAALKVAHLAIIPSKASPLDLRALGPTIRRVRDEKVPMVFVLSMAKVRTKLFSDAMLSLSAHGQIAGVYGERVDWPTAMIDGRVAQELNPSGASADEARRLAATVVEKMNLQPRPAAV